MTGMDPQPAMGRAYSGGYRDGCGPLVLAAPAAAKDLDKHVAVNCPAPLSQTCTPRGGMSVVTGKDTTSAAVGSSADPNPPACALARRPVCRRNALGPAELVQPGGQTGSTRCR